MYWLKSCSKCRGDLYKQADVYGDYIACMHCGRYLTAEEQSLLAGGVPSGDNKPVVIPSDPQVVAA